MHADDLSLVYEYFAKHRRNISTDTIVCTLVNYNFSHIYVNIVYNYVSSTGTLDKNIIKRSWIFIYYKIITRV
jgi:hypothetical protein